MSDTNITIIFINLNLSNPQKTYGVGSIVNPISQVRIASVVVTLPNAETL